MAGRHILNEEDKMILNLTKSFISTVVEKLQERGVRDVNIHIELVEHIKDCLK